MREGLDGARATQSAVLCLGLHIFNTFLLMRHAYALTERRSKPQGLLVGTGDLRSDRGLQSLDVVLHRIEDAHTEVE